MHHGVAALAIDVAKDAMQAMTTFEWPNELALPGYRPTTRPHGKQVREAARLILESRRPVLYVGGGVLKARATAELRVLAEVTGIPVVNVNNNCSTGSTALFWRSNSSRAVSRASTSIRRSPWEKRHEPVRSTVPAAVPTPAAGGSAETGAIRPKSSRVAPYSRM